MIDVDATIKRLLRPPSVANWARHNFRRLDETSRGLLRFATVPPRHSLGDVYTICAAIVTDQLSLEQALRCADEIKHPLTRRASREIVPAFYYYAKGRKLDGLSAFKGFRTPYPIGRSSEGGTLTIPVIPTFTMLTGDQLKPVFLIGWASLTLNDYQKQLLSTIIRNAILTQQDFLNSDAEVVCIPRCRRSGGRIVQDWSVRQYAQLTEDDLQEQFARYGSALDQVIRRLRGD